MKISSLHICNYKSLYDFKTSGFNEVNMVYGLNNSGKSNLLKFLHNIFIKKSVERTTRGVDSRGDIIEHVTLEYTDFWEGEISNAPYQFFDNSKNITFEITFKLSKEEIPYSDLLVNEKIIKSINREIPICIKGELIFKNETALTIQLNEVNISNNIIFRYINRAPEYFPSIKNNSLGQSHLENILRKFNDCVLLLDSNRYLIEESERKVNKFALNSPQVFKNWLFNLYLYNYNNFLEFIIFLDKFNIETGGNDVIINNQKNNPLKNADIGFTKFGEEIEIMLKNLVGRFPLKNYGTGIQQIIYILAKLFDSKSEIILIEELELNLSPKYQLEFIKFFKSLINSQNGRSISQLFFTTHSYNFCHRNDLFKYYEITINAEGKSDINASNRSKFKKMFNEGY